MDRPEAFDRAIRSQFTDGDALLEALSQPPKTSILCNPFKSGPTPQGTTVAWNAHGLHLAERPSFTYDPLFHAGLYYPQESSSMIVEFLVRELLKDGPQEPVVLDLCAAPGGKSLNILNALEGRGVLLSNEVIRPRSAILAETVSKWGCSNVLVSNNDPRDFQALEGVFDLILVDAPCSGEGMFRKDPEAMTHWSREAVEMCAARQRRILSEALQALAPGGVLIYSTCTFNPIENDANVDWLHEQASLEPALPAVPNTEHILADSWGWRFLPHRTGGEGLFVTALRQQDGHRARPLSKKHKQRLPQPDKQLALAVAEHIGTQPLVAHKDVVSVLPVAGHDLLLRGLEALLLVQVGTPIGNWAKRAILPEHAWALSNHLSLPGAPLELDREDALKYLARQPFEAPEAKGWVRLTHQGHALGLGKGLGNRINNYYPKHWRIRHLP